MAECVTATAYLVVEGKRRSWGNDLYEKGRVVSSRTNKPAQLLVDQVAVKVTLKIPKLAFEALTPEAVIEIPEDLVQRPVWIEAAEAADPCV